VACGKPEDINFNPLALLVHLSGDEVGDNAIYFKDLG